MDLSFEIQETNVRIRIHIFEIPYVPIFRQNGQLLLFWHKFLKNGFWVGNSENLCWNKNPHPRDTMFANCQAKQTTLTFLALICPKMDLGLEIQKTNVGIRISILETPCVPIFRQNGQL